MHRLALAIPSYNRPDYLAECLESIAAQSFRDFDVLVVDNASTVDYAPIISRFQHLGIQYVRNPENIGGARNIDKARNLASRAPYHIVFHDDDLMHPQMLEQQVVVLDSHPDMAWVATECRPFEEEPSTPPDAWKQSTGALEVYETPGELVRRILENVGLNFGSVMYRSEASRHAKLRLHEFEIIADRVLLCDLAARGPVGLIREPLVLYRHHADQGTHDPILRELHALALMEYYQQLLPRPLSEADRSLVERHSTNFLLHTRAAVSPASRLPLAELVGSARSEGLFKWSSIDGQGIAALARIAGAGSLFDAARPTLGRAKRLLNRLSLRSFG